MSDRPKRRGRRPIADEPATATINLRVTPGQRIELQRVAAENRTTLAGAIRDAVNSYCADYRESGAVFRRPPRHG